MPTPGQAPRTSQFMPTIQAGSRNIHMSHRDSVVGLVCACSRLFAVLASHFHRKFPTSLNPCTLHQVPTYWHRYIHLLGHFAIHAYSFRKYQVPPALSPLSPEIKRFLEAVERETAADGDFGDVKKDLFLAKVSHVLQVQHVFTPVFLGLVAEDDTMFGKKAMPPKHRRNS